MIIFITDEFSYNDLVWKTGRGDVENLISQYFLTKYLKIVIVTIL